MIEYITDDEVVSKIKPEGLSLIRLTADYCGPCKMFSPVLEAFVEETGTPTYNLDIVANSQTPRDHQVMSIPTTLVYYDGNLVNKILGAKSLASFKKELAPYLTTASE